MRLIRRLPVYAAGVGFTAALVGVADAREWSGWRTALVALVVGLFYVVTILVPWLIREQIADADKAPASVASNGNHWSVALLRVDSDAQSVLVPRGGSDWSMPIPATRGPIAILRPSEPQVTGR